MVAEWYTVLWAHLRLQLVEEVTAQRLQAS